MTGLSGSYGQTSRSQKTTSYQGVHVYKAWYQSGQKMANASTFNNKNPMHQ